MSHEVDITSSEDIQAVLNFQEYLRIPSVHPNINYDECVAFLQRQASALDLPINVYTFVEGKPVIVFSWKGLQPSLPSILLNSHMDVVPVIPEKWTKPPFAAEKDKEGNIYGRGTQDMKCVGIQHLEAVSRLKRQGVRLKRTVHISFVPDEEIGGENGMKKFVESPEFAALNVGFSLDESCACPSEEMILFYGENSIWSTQIHCTGTPGHGSLLLPNTAGEKVRIVLDRFMDFRKQQQKLAMGEEKVFDPYKAKNVTSVNLTKLEGGVQVNVIPPELTLTFDVRVSASDDHEELEKLLNTWCEEAGPGTHITYVQKDPKFGFTNLDQTNPWWVVFKKECDTMGIKLMTHIAPGTTDARYLRVKGIPAFGFSPINFTPIRLHSHDEFLNERIFIKGIHIFTQLIKALGNML